MTNKYMKKCSASMAVKEKQIKMTLRFHLTPIRMAIIRNTTIASEDVEKRNPYTLLMGEYISAATMEISIEAHQKTKNRATI
jgi:hypothetical protein